MMSVTQPKRPRQLTMLAVVYIVLGLWNLWTAFRTISGDLEVWGLLSDLSVDSWFRMAIPAEIGIYAAVLVAALIQLITVPLLMMGKPQSVKLALGVFISIAVLNMISGVLYASAPPEIRDTLGSDMILSIGLGIFQMFLAAVFWRDLNKPEVVSFMRRSNAQEIRQGASKICEACGQQIPVASEKCYYCGASQSFVSQNTKKESGAELKFFCRYCGSENKPDALYCDRCGKRLRES